LDNFKIFRILLNIRQFRNTSYWVTENGDIYKYYPEHNSQQSFTRQDGKLWVKNYHRPAYYKKCKPSLSNKGYYQVNFKTKNTNNKNLNLRINRMVAECYIGLIPEGYVVDHIDGNKINNHYSNLQFLTDVENKQKNPRGWLLFT